MGGQQWWKSHSNHKIGFGNYVKIAKDLSTDVVNAFVNVMSVSSELYDPQSELVLSFIDRVHVYSSGCSPEIRVNGKVIGSTCIPAELIKINYDGKQVFLQVFYDEGSQISLTNREIAPLVFGTRPSEGAIRIGSVNGDTSKIRPVHSIALGLDRDIEAVSVPDLALHTAEIQRPKCLKKYDGLWAFQLGRHRGQIPAQVLIGVDTSHVFPVSVVHADGTPVQTKDARLMRSMLTGRYLLFGSAKEDDELFHQKFPEIDKNGLAGVAHLGAEAVHNELAEYYQSCLEDVKTM